MRDNKIGLWGAVSLAVGTMIGASIFSIFGLGARLAGQNLPWVFVVSGLLAFLVAYSYATLGRRLISDAGPVEFILKCFGDGVLTGTLSFLFWLTYVISIALFASGFAGYLVPLLHLDDLAWSHDAIEVTVVLAFTALGLLGSASVGRAETFIVLVKLTILGLFIVLGISGLNPARLTPESGPAVLSGSVTAVAVFFLSYMGFGLVTSASEHMRDAPRNVPRAIYLSIFIVSVIYVAVAAVAVGNLSQDALLKAGDNALAVAAEPLLGKTGYLLISIGALFSIASALNATLYGGANVAFALAHKGELPPVFERKLWFGSNTGLYLTAALGIALVLFSSLASIASITSSVFIVIYLFVLIAHWRLSREMGGSRWIIGIGMVAVALVFIDLMHYQWNAQRQGFYTTWAILIERVYRVKPVGGLLRGN
jgi:amino acid transporter